MTLSRPILALLTTSLLFAAAGGRGQPVTMPSLVTLDDFESYASSNALAAVWSNFAGAGVIGLETNIVCGGTQALRLKYSLAASPNTNTVARTFSSPQDWSTFNTITFNYGGTSGNSTDNVIVRILDHLGGVLGSFTLTGATTYSPCTNVILDLSKQTLFTNTSHQTDLRDVQTIVLGVAGGTSRGSGTIYFDNLVVGNNGNLAANPGFQDLNNDSSFGDGWNTFGVQQFLNVLPYGTPGHATFYSDTTGNTGGVYWAGSPTLTGTKYRLNVDAYAESQWHALAQFGVQFLDSDNTTVLAQRIVNMFGYTNLPATYKTYSMTAVVPPGVSAVRPWIAYANAVRQSGASARAMLDNTVLAVETTRVLSILGASIHKGMYSSGTYINYTINGSFGHSFGALLTTALATNGWRVDNRSISGDNTTNVVNRFYVDETPVGADVVFIGLSMGNQGLPGAANPQAIYNSYYMGITNLIAMSRANGMKVIVGGGFPRDKYTTNEFAWLKKTDLLLNTLDVPTVNFLGATENGIGKFLPLLSAGDGIHFNDPGHNELYLCFVPSVFDAMMAGKPTPTWSGNRKFARILADPQQPAPISFTPSSTVHSFSASFRVRSVGTGTVASITLPASINHPTVEVMPTGLAYVASNGVVVSSSISGLDGAWHEVMVVHQYARTQTWFYVDSVLAGTVTERLAPVGFVLGGPGNAATRPGSPSSADYENWFIHRSALTIDQVTAHFQGALQQSSLEVYAPLDDDTLVAGGSATNCAQSLSIVTVNGSNVLSQPVVPVAYSPGRVWLNLYGIPSYPYEIQRAATPDFSPYSVLLSITGTPPNGLVSLSDTNPPSPSGFYRLKQQ